MSVKTSKKATAFSREGGRKILGFNKDGLIKRFFQGNALLAVLFLVAICGFLFKEAFFFFPDYHKSLTLYRKSGQEFVSLLEDQYKAQKSSFALVDQAYNIERSASSAAELSRLSLFNDLRGDIADETEDLYDEWDDAFSELEDARDELEDADPEDQATANQALTEATTTETNARLAWKEAAAEAVADIGEKPYTNPEMSDAQWSDMTTAFLALEPDTGQSDYAAALQTVIDDRVGKFGTARNALQKSIKPLESLWLELRDIAAETKDAGISFKTAADRKSALLEGAQNQKDPEKSAALLARADAVNTVEPDFTAAVQPLYAAEPRASKLSADLIASIDTAFQNLPQPESLSNELAADKLDQAFPLLKTSISTITERAEDLRQWKHDKPYSFFRSTMGFFFGTKWVTNSSWQDFYGLLPLFSGSLLISVVALALAVPFSVAAAIYTNQLAHPWEAKFIKPTIEFIQAIPSVVLGLFGILVLGESLRTLSDVTWLQWIPGFPMQERLNVLNAGVLLALMAVPTVYTLAEDAINNVPRAFRDASFALGATKLQTVLKVIVPTAVSGIIAAILLGFGRVIGETMVVLLVAGNKIAIPDFSEGLGVLTQPVHTMTGLIAQETGEVNQGSLHWRALFMVGLILFCVSLTINYISQSLIRRFQLKN